MKVFDKQLHADNDSIAKSRVLNFLSKLGYDAIENPNDYGVDIMIASVEVERRPLWKGRSFPFGTVNIPCRKEKFFKNNIKYYVLNFDCTYALTCDSQFIISCPKVDNPNKYVEKELFYSVPIKCFELLELR